MNRIIHSLAFKVTAIFLFVITVLVFIAGIIGIAVFYHYDYYVTSVENVKKEVFENITREYANSVYYRYFFSGIYEYNNPTDALPVPSSNFLFTLKNQEGEIIFSNYSGEDYKFSWIFEFNEAVYTAYSEENTYETYTMECYVKNPLDTDDYYFVMDRLVDFTYKMKYSIIVISILAMAASIILFIVLMCSAGRRKGIEGVMPNGIDKIPFDLLLGIIVIFFVFEALIFEEMRYFDIIGYIISLSIFAIVDILLLLLICMSFATRYKLGGWWRNTVIYRILSFFGRIFKKTADLIKYFFRNRSLVTRAILILTGIMILEFAGLCISYDQEGLLVFLWIIEKLLLGSVIILVAISLHKLKLGGQKIAMGDLNYKVDTRYMFWDFKDHGENLNRINEGMARAVEERLRSERFKTELITNVSHDIKTPLTSIINYVDLIKKENIENEKLKEYISVLDRQSARLKKLTEDLVEASKASTGNLPVNLAPTEIGVLFTQAAGEYEERIKNSGLELILNKPTEEIYIMADGRLLWRVFDNLLNNICKYAQPGTRVYLDLEKINGQAVITFRNISRYALNIPSDELLERFVRGDRSRNTEGSGLGLSIAKSLTELQNGSLELYIDGDLFKVILRFNVIDMAVPMAAF